MGNTLTKRLVDELIEDIKTDRKIVKSFYSKDTLTPFIFDNINDEYKLDEVVRDKLLNISNDFIDFLGVEFFIHDIVLTGSLANFNWSKYSDIDIHVIIDFDETGHNKILLTQFFDAKISSWNKSHNITIKNYEVEIYVQDLSEKHVSSGVYSILNNKWLIKPQKEKHKIDDNKILKKGEEYAKLIDDLIEKKEDGDNIAIEASKIKKKLKKFRQSGLDDGGEYSYENLTFKLLRRNGYIEKLLNLKNKLIDKKLSSTE